MSAESVAPQSVRFPKGEDGWTRAQANGLLRVVEDMFHRVDIDALVHGFTEDCVFRFAEQPERRGRQALREFFAARLSRQMQAGSVADLVRFAARLGDPSAGSLPTRPK